MKKLIRIMLILLLMSLTPLIVACSVKSNPIGQPLGTVTDYRSTENRPIGRGLPAPDFQFIDTSGRTMLLSDLKDKVVLINIWSVDCIYCVQEMSILEKAYEGLRNLGLVVLGINNGDATGRVKNFLSKRTITFEIILDPDVYASTLYEARYLPTTYIIDKTGKIMVEKIGSFASDTEIISLVKPLLGQ